MTKLSKKHPLTILGFDYGRVFIGIAVGQTLTKTAQPLTTLKAQQGSPHWDEIEKIISVWQPDALVVGIPLNMDGTEQKITRLARQFANQLKEKFHLPVYSVDERLTTVDARRQLFEEGGYRALKKAAVDALSAKLIVENWMAEE